MAIFSKEKIGHHRIYRFFGIKILSHTRGGAEAYNFHD